MYNWKWQQFHSHRAFFQKENIPLADDEWRSTSFMWRKFTRAELLRVDRSIDAPPLWLGRGSLPEKLLFYDFRDILPSESKVTSLRNLQRQIFFLKYELFPQTKPMIVFVWAQKYRLMHCPVVVQYNNFVIGTQQNWSWI